MFISFKNNKTYDNCKECNTPRYYYGRSKELSCVDTCREIILEDVFNLRPMIFCKKITITLSDYKKVSPKTVTNVMNLIKAVIYTQTNLNLSPKLSRNANYLAINLDGKAIDYLPLLSVIMYFMKIGNVLPSSTFKTNLSSKKQTHADLMSYIINILDNINDNNLSNRFYDRYEMCEELPQIRDALRFIFNKGGIEKLVKDSVDKSKSCKVCGRQFYDGILDFFEDIS